MILPIYFLEKNISPEVITFVIGIAATPIIVKFIWGGITDYFIQYGRKRFIILGGVLSIISLLLLAFIDPGSALIPFAIFTSICWCGVGFLDVSADAWAIEISQENERGKINGAMFAGQNSGMAIGALLLPFVAKIFGYKAVFLASSLIIFLIILFPLLIKEIKIVKKRPKLTKLLISEFKKKTTMIITFFSIVFGFSAGMLLFIAPIYMDIGLKLDLSQIGLITMTFTIAMAIGSLIGGILADKWGRKITIFTLMVISIFFSASLVITDNWQNFTIIYAVIGFLQGGYHAAALAMFMDFTNPRVGATQFSIFMGLGNFGNIGIASISGTLYAILSFDHVFLYSAWIFGPALLILYFIRLKKNI